MRVQALTKTIPIMAAKVPRPLEYPVHAFSTVSDLEKFYDREHAKLPGFYLKIAKKSSGIQSVSREEGVEVALCFGWIDGWGRSLDDQWSVTRYTPRRPKSLWSKKNVNTVARHVEAGRMRPAGIAQVEAAKADGRWDRAYAGPATITVADDMAAALSENPAAASFFETLNKTDRYAVLWRIETSSPKNRPNKIETLIKLLADGKVPGRSEPGAKPKRKADVETPKPTLKKTQVAKAKAKSTPSKQAKSLKPVDEEKAKVPRRAGLRSRS